jgi:hypothetical protein
MEQSGERSRVLRENEIRLSWDGNQICALVGPDLIQGVAGFGDGVHNAPRNLDVTNRTEWNIREKSD